MIIVQLLLLKQQVALFAASGRRASVWGALRGYQACGVITCVLLRFSPAAALRRLHAASLLAVDIVLRLPVCVDHHHVSVVRDCIHVAGSLLPGLCHRLRVAVRRVVHQCASVRGELPTRHNSWLEVGLHICSGHAWPVVQVISLRLCCACVMVQRHHDRDVVQR